MSRGRAPGAAEAPTATPVVDTPGPSIASRNTIVTAEPTESTFERVSASNFPWQDRIGVVRAAITITNTVIIIVGVSTDYKPIITTTPLGPCRPGREVGRPETPVAELYPKGT